MLGSDDPTTLRSGPGYPFEAVQNIERGTRVWPVVRINDADGNVWWQLHNGHWLPASTIEESGPCPDVPLTDVVQAPRYNRFSLETCTPSNGPLRAGQSVEFYFVPPGWDGYEEALEATRVDPGRITVDSVQLTVYVSEPQFKGEARYVRTFSAYWTATPGTHRIVGERTFYVINCDVTVPAGPYSIAERLNTAAASSAYRHKDAGAGQCSTRLLS